MMISGDVTLPGGSTTQVQYNNAGAFAGDAGLTFDSSTGKLTIGKQLVIASGAVTSDAPLLNLTQTWNSAGTTFNGVKLNVTDTASNASSLLMDLQVGGSSKFRAYKNGGLVALNNCGFNSSGYIGGWSGGQIGFSNAATWSDSAALDTYISRDAAGTMALRNSTNAQVWRVYGTTDSSTTNYERGKVAWESSILRIGTEKGGTGVARALELQTDGTTRLSLGATANSTIGTDNTYGVYLRYSTAAQLSVDSLGVGIRNSIGLPLSYINTNEIGALALYDSAGTSFKRLQLGGTTASFPAIKRNGAAVNFRVADDSADADITAKAATFSGNVTVSAVNIVTDGTTGTKIGTATTQKLGFFNAAPVVQPNAVADSTGTGDVVAQLNALLARMRSLGLIAT